MKAIYLIIYIFLTLTKCQNNQIPITQIIPQNFQQIKQIPIPQKIKPQKLKQKNFQRFQQIQQSPYQQIQQSPYQIYPYQNSIPISQFQFPVKKKRIPKPIIEELPEIFVEQEPEKTDEELNQIITDYLNTPSEISDDLIDFSMESRYNNILKKNNKQIIPLKISLKYPEINVENIRTALDLVLVIDISGSMSGQKMKLVKETLIFIIDQLSSIDRLGLVTFNQSVKVLSELKSMTQENKKLYKDLVKKHIYAGGSTNIVDGLEKGLDMLLEKEVDFERERTNAIFFLSDGQDTVGNRLSDLQEVLLEQNENLKKKEMDYVIHSFGYGSGHDENWLTKISNFKNGNFYYIRDLNLVADSIIDPLSALLTVIGREAKIKIFLQDNFNFSQKFGDNWNSKYKKKEGEINVGVITPEMDRDFVAEVYIEDLEDNNMNEYLLEVATAVLLYKTEEGEFTKIIQLKLNIIKDEENLGEVNKEVEEAYYKQLAALELKSFEKLRSEGRYEEAKVNINKFRTKFESNSYISDDFKEKLEKVTDIKKISDRKVTKQLYNVLSADQYAPGFVNFKYQTTSAKNRTKQFYSVN